MTDTGTQRMRVTFEYDAQIFEGDPADMYVLAQEEASYLLGSLSGYDVDDSTLTVVPILNEKA